MNPPSGPVVNSSEATTATIDEAKEKDCIKRLKHLKALYENEFITQADYETRKSQIVDDLTGTSSGTQSMKLSHHKRSTQQSSFVPTTLDETKSNERVSADPMNIVLADGMRNEPNEKRKKRSKHKKIDVIPHPPPDWTKIRSEKAERWIYDYLQEKWFLQQCKVKIDEVPFDKGGLRYVFHLHDLTHPNKKYVAKMSQDMRDNINKEIYFKDVKMQAIARHFCHGPKGYNSYGPPKLVDFLEAYVLHLKQREGSPVCHVEQYIPGSYKKYNNNTGWVSEEERNTPHAFAHFTYEASKRKLLVCDIQGVGDVYTDPQVHSSQNLKAFGRGNLGARGFEHFERSHRCNPICRYLTLQNINKLPIKQMGTLPAKTEIAAGGISTVPFDFAISGQVPLLAENGFPKIVEPVKEETSSTEHGEYTSCWDLLCIVL